MLNKKSLGTSLLKMEKGESCELVYNGQEPFVLDQFAVVHNSSTGQDMICFTVESIEGKYFWASTSLYNFLKDNIENAEYDGSSMTYEFPDDYVFIEYVGKTQLKNDPSKSCNVWNISTCEKGEDFPFE